MVKRDSTPACRSSRQKLSVRPTLFFNDAPQSDEFVAGALAACDIIAALCSEDLPGEGSFADERKHAARLTEPLLRILERPGDARLGAMAALAHFIVISSRGFGPPDNEWLPLECVPDPSTSNDEICKVAAGSLFFGVAGEPVSVGPELVAYGWSGPMEYRRVSVELVRMVGKPIGACEFERRRLIGCTAD